MLRWLLVVVLAGVATPVFAASQGDWGRTSTATAKITLRILPHDHGTPIESVRYLTGRAEGNAYAAVQASCTAASPFNRSAALFTANVLGHSDGNPTLDADSLLRASCRGVAVHRAQAATDTQHTVLVSPI